MSYCVFSRSDHGLALAQCQSIIWTNDGLLLNGPLGINVSIFNGMWIKIQQYPFIKMWLKMSSSKWWPFALSLSDLTHLPLVQHMQWVGSALVQIMAYCLLGTKPLSKPMLGYCQLDPKEQTSVKFQSKYKTFHSQKCIWKHRLLNGGHFVPGEMS